MATIAELQALLQPTQQDRSRDMAMGLLNFGSGILANNRGNYGALGPALGAGLQQGLQGYQQSQQMGRTNRVQDLLQKMELEKYAAAQAQEEQKKRWMGSMPQPTYGFQAPASMLSGQPTDPMSPMTTQQAVQPTPESTRDWMVRGGMVAPEQAKTMADIYKSFEPKKPESMLGKINPSDYPSEKVARFQQTGNYADLGQPIDKRAKTSTTVVNSAADPFKNEGKLRDDFRAEPLYKSSSEMQNAFNTIEVAFKKPSPANDLAMATKYMKILDPTSVVRESELMMAMNATGLVDRLYNYANMIQTGEKLNPTQRKDFYDSAKAINDSFQAEKNKLAETYKGLAKGYNLNPENVVFGTKGGYDFSKADSILGGM